MEIGKARLLGWPWLSGDWILPLLWRGGGERGREEGARDEERVSTGARREHEIDRMKRKALSAGFILVSRCWKHRPRGFMGDETGFISLQLNFMTCHLFCLCDFLLNVYEILMKPVLISLRKCYSILCGSLAFVYSFDATFFHKLQPVSVPVYWLWDPIFLDIASALWKV